MGIVNATEKISGQDATFSQAARSGNTEYAATRVWSVLLDDPATNAYDAVDYGTIPNMGASHPDNSNLKMVTKTGRRVGRLLVDVSCTYAGPASPLSEPYDRGWRMASSSEPIYYTWDGVPIVNPLKERYVGVVMPHDDPVYVVTRNEASDPVQEIADHINSCNSATITIGGVTWAIYTAKLKITGDRIVDGGSSYWRVAYETAFRTGPAGWQWYQEERGHRYWDGTTLAGGNKNLEPMPPQQALSEDVRIGATGLKLDDGDASVYYTWEILEPVNYNLLGIY